VAGVAHGPAGWRIRLGSGPHRRLVGLVDSVLLSKENRQVSSITPQRALALLAVVCRGGRGWKQRGGAKMAGLVIHPVGAPARAGSKAKHLALAASGRGLARQGKLWRAWASDRDLEGLGDASRSGAG